MTKIGVSIARDCKKSVSMLKEALARKIMRMSNTEFFLLSSFFAMMFIFLVGLANGQIQPMPL